MASTARGFLAAGAGPGPRSASWTAACGPSCWTCTAGRRRPTRRRPGRARPRDQGSGRAARAGRPVAARHLAVPRDLPGRCGSGGAGSSRWCAGGSRAHPDDVVTLILEDDVSLADVRATVTAAGLDPWLATPPAPGARVADPAADDPEATTRWPSSPRTPGPAAGPIRNFYQYAAETPFAAATSAALSCAPGRGAATAPLFLVNNWVTMTIPTPACRPRRQQPDVPAATGSGAVRPSAGCGPPSWPSTSPRPASPLHVVDELNAR